MPVSIKGTGGGSVTLSAAAAAADTTLTLPNTTGTVALTASPTFSGTLTATTITSPASTALTFQYGGTTGATLDASGNLLVGTTTATLNNTGFRVVSGASQSDRAELGSTATTSANIGWSMYSTGAAAYRFYVNWAGTVFATNTTISGISDQRLKENIRDLDVGLDAIMALKPRKFDWKDGRGKNIKDDRGFIAQEIEEIFPDLIDEWADPAPEGEAPYKSVRADLIPVLVKAIQELSAKNDALEARLAALEAK